MTKILLDSCVSGNFLRPLQDAGYDVLWTGHWEKTLVVKKS